MLRCSHELPGFSLYIRPYHPSLSTGLLNYILCPHRAIVRKFLLVVQPWHVHVKGSLRVLYCFFSSVSLKISMWLLNFKALVTV